MNSQPVVMITGAAHGLGNELVEVFSRNGYQVFATARTIPEKSEAGITWYKLDVADYAQCKEALTSGFNRFGHIDVLINNASSYTGGVTITQISVEDIDKEMAVTLRAPIYLSKLYVEFAKPQQSGKIISISSIAGLAGEPNCELYSVYSAAKAGILRFAECLHEDIKSYGMQAHVVVPCNMQSKLNEPEHDAITYDAAARFIVNIASSDSNLSISKSILRPT